MAESLLMKKGLEELFNPERRFEGESAYGRKILYVAWAVEILAALIGLTIAGATAYDAYKGIENPNESHLINALIGALPFIIIAIIEPTKIPLAGGFYKTRILSWKILILVALIGLTVVTFETMFNGLERNLTNVTREVVESENKIHFLTDQLSEKERELKHISELSADNITSDLKNTLSQITNSYNSFIQAENKSRSDQINPIMDQKRQSKIINAGLSSINNAEIGVQLQAISSRISNLNIQLENTQKSSNIDINNYVKNISDKQLINANRSKSKINSFSKIIKEKRKEINSIKKLLNKKKEKLEKDIADYQNELGIQISKLNAEERVEKSGTFFSGSIDEKYKKLRNKINLKQEEREKRLKVSYDNDEEKEQQNALLLKNEIYDLNKKIKSLTLFDPKPIEVKQDKLDYIKNQSNQKLSNIRKKIEGLETQRDRILSVQSGDTKQQQKILQEKIKQLDSQINDITTASSTRIKRRKMVFSEEQEKIEKQRNSLVLKINEKRKNIIPKLENEIIIIQENIDLNKKIKRTASYDNQVYRIAALGYGKTDVAEVTRDEVKVVALIWFGSISLIISTIGTILAFISYILRDPEAFVERKKFSFSRRMMRICYVVFGRTNRVLLTGTKFIFAGIKFVISFAELFRGLFGIPLQKAFRKMFLAYRKRINRPRIEKIEVEVEKIIEVKVEKIIEVEKIVEKIIRVEIPVDKIVIKEVPIEIIRKELIYVPLYSTESGLIDASTELKGSKPVLDKDTHKKTASNTDIKNNHELADNEEISEEEQK